MGSGMSLAIEERTKYAERHLEEALTAVEQGANIVVVQWLIEDALRLLKDESAWA
jgi:hypothetical protein